MMKKASRSSRRHFLGRAAAALPVLLAAADDRAAAQGAGPRPARAQPLKAVCVGAHPDDPESGCGGTLARYTAAGHRVTVIYLTRGEAGVRGRSAASTTRMLLVLSSLLTPVSLARCSRLS